MSAPLSHLQKRLLSQLARRAWELADREVGTAEEFRRAEVARACGKAGLRCCSQDDFLRVRAHFLDLCGEPGAAFNDHVRAESEPLRQAQAVLRRECERFGLSLNYANAICRNQNGGAGLDAVGEQKIWQLIYTIRNRGNARRRNEK